MNEFVAKQKQAKQIKLLIMALVMVAASVFCLSLNALLFRIIGIIGALFFGVCFLFILVRLLRPKTMLVVNKDGIDYSSTGVLPWKYVAGFEVTDLLGQTFISIQLNDVDAYLAAIPAWKAKAVRANMALGYPPLSLMLQTADCTLNEALEAMKYFRDFYIKEHDRGL